LKKVLKTDAPAYSKEQPCLAFSVRCNKCVRYNYSSFGYF